MKIAFISAEVVPFAKTGGLADVAGALPKTLAKNGNETIIIMPHYKVIDNEKYHVTKLTDHLTISLGENKIDMTVYKSDAIEGVTTYLIGNGNLFYRDGIYGHHDDEYRFTAFCRGVMELLPLINFRPDVMHANDWHTSLIPVYLKTIYNNDFYKKTASVYTIHNLAYQGNFGRYVLDIAELSQDLFTSEYLEFYGEFNFMKAGLVFGDKINTVSETYAKEIQTPEYGEKLDGVLISRKDDLSGIVNGIDYDIWSPSKDEYIYKNFSIDNLEVKYQNKRELQHELGFVVHEDIPMFGLVSRLSYQKGLDLLVDSLNEILGKTDMQIVVLGTGDELYHEQLLHLTKRFPEKVSTNFRFNEPLSHQIYASSDFFLMPSRYEPCGLGQLISMSYGTLPIVRATGGLEDTVREIDITNNTSGNGFKFTDQTKEALIEKINKAISLYNNKDIMRKSIQNAMLSDYSWEISAQKYFELYQKSIDKVRQIG